MEILEQLNIVHIRILDVRVEIENDFLSVFTSLKPIFRFSKIIRITVIITV